MCQAAEIGYNCEQVPMLSDGIHAHIPAARPAENLFLILFWGFDVTGWLRSS